MTGLEPDLLGQTLVARMLAQPGTPGTYLVDEFANGDLDALRTGFGMLGYR